MSEKEKDSRAVSIAATRFPWVPAFQERYGVDQTQWRALCDAIYPSAKTLDSIVLVLAYCKSRDLDPFKRPVHIVPMYDKSRGGTVDTIWPGIGELRTTAVRTGSFAGQDAAEFGPTVKNRYGEAELEHPEWCAVTVYRMVQGHRVAIHGPRVYWRETYASKKHDDPTPNSMWQKRPFGQLEKCANAGALRAAFPEELGNDYAAEEMEGKTIEGQFSHVAREPEPIATRQPSQNKLADFASPPPAPPSDPQDDEALHRAALTAIKERLVLARTEKAYKAVRNDAIVLMGKFDAAWPQGKEELVAALSETEARFNPGEQSSADSASA